MAALIFIGCIGFIRGIGDCETGYFLNQYSKLDVRYSRFKKKMSGVRCLMCDIRFLSQIKNHQSNKSSIANQKKGIGYLVNGGVGLKRLISISKP